MSKFSKDLMALIKYRRSVRLFNGQKIPEAGIKSIIDAGIWAPSGCNNQELKFLILDRDEDIANITKFKPFLTGASHFILIFYDTALPRSKEMYKNKHQKMLPYVDAGLALSNMLLCAKSKGIDSCVLNFSDYYFAPGQKPLKKATNKVLAVLGLNKFSRSSFKQFLMKDLKVPKHLEIVCGVVFGYGRRYPDINTEMHSGDKVMRKDVSYYVIKRNG